jgi:hypothetical protein
MATNITVVTTTCKRSNKIKNSVCYFSSEVNIYTLFWVQGFANSYFSFWWYWLNCWPRLSCFKRYIVLILDWSSNTRYPCLNCFKTIIAVILNRSIITWCQYLNCFKSCMVIILIWSTIAQLAKILSINYSTIHYFCWINNYINLLKMFSWNTDVAYYLESPALHIIRNTWCCLVTQ